MSQLYSLWITRLFMGCQGFDLYKDLYSIKCYLSRIVSEIYDFEQLY